MCWERGVHPETMRGWLRRQVRGSRSVTWVRVGVWDWEDRKQRPVPPVLPWFMCTNTPADKQHTNVISVTCTQTCGQTYAFCKMQGGHCHHGLNILTSANTKLEGTVLREHLPWHNFQKILVKFLWLKLHVKTCIFNPNKNLKWPVIVGSGTAEYSQCSEVRVPTIVGTLTVIWNSCPHNTALV